MMTRMTAVGPEAFSRSGLTSMMREGKLASTTAGGGGGGSTRRERLLGISPPVVSSTPSPLSIDPEDLREEDLYDENAEEQPPPPPQKDQVRSATTTPLGISSINRSARATATRMIPQVVAFDSSARGAPPSTPPLHHQSAPVKVPDWSKIMRSNKENGGGFGGGFTDFVDDGGGYGGDADLDDDIDQELHVLRAPGEFKKIPPHELVAREYARSHTAFSVYEGAGRTLKGRDLSRVRNAIWKQTGFLGG